MTFYTEGYGEAEGYGEVTADLRGKKGVARGRERVGWGGGWGGEGLNKNNCMFI